MTRTLIATAMLCLLAATPAPSQDAETLRKAVETRQGLMKVVLWNVVPMAAMAKERIPYDPAAFELHAGRVAFLLEMAPEAFRLDTRAAVEVPTEALDVVWERKETFDERARNATQKARAAAVAARDGDLASAQTAFLEMGEACKACHDDFREET